MTGDTLQYPACDAANPQGMRFCGECGAALARARDAERRQLTVMFVDVVDSVRLAESLDGGWG